MTYRILFLGDIVGRPGRVAVQEGLPLLLQRHSPLFTIANGENSAAGVGITPDIACELYDLGVDAITLGNHAFHRREIYAFLDSDNRIARPANMPPAVPGKGLVRVQKAGVELNVINLCGRVFMEAYDDPFRKIDELLEQCNSAHIFVDFHAEATSEKIAFAWYVNGRVSAVVGTHTHVQTCDERILPGNTATITDVGMCGPINSVLGMDKDVILRRFKTGMHERFEVANNPGVISGVLIDVEKETGRATAIERVRLGEGF